MNVPPGYRLLVEGELIPDYHYYLFHTPSTDKWRAPEGDSEKNREWHDQTHHPMIVRVDGEVTNVEDLIRPDPTNVKLIRSLQMILTVTHPAHPAYKIAYDALQENKTTEIS